MEYGLIGNPLGHSFSKPIHEALGGYAYRLCPLEPEALPGFLQRRDFLGVNVTIPYKAAVIPYLDQVDQPYGIRCGPGPGRPAHPDRQPGPRPGTALL